MRTHLLCVVRILLNVPHSPHDVLSHTCCQLLLPLLPIYLWIELVCQWVYHQRQVLFSCLSGHECFLPSQPCCLRCVHRHSNVHAMSLGDTIHTKNGRELVEKWVSELMTNL